MADPVQSNRRPLAHWNEQTLAELKTPATPSDRVNKALEGAYENAKSLTETRLKSREIAPAVTAGDSSQSANNALHRNVLVFIEETTREVLKQLPMPPATELNQWFKELGLTDLQAAHERFYRDYTNNLRRGVVEKVETALNNGKNQNIGGSATLSSLILALKQEVDRPTSNDTKTLIARARDVLEQLDPGEAKKLTNKLSSSELNLDGPSYEFMARNLAMVGSTLAAFGLSYASFVTLQTDQAWVITGAGMIVNCVVNVALFCRHEARMRQLIYSTKTQIKEASSMPAAVMWVGVMSHVLDKYNPILFLGRKKCCSLGSNTADTTVDYTRDSLRDLAVHACGGINPRSLEESLSSIAWLNTSTVVNRKWAQIESNVNSLSGRWNTIPYMFNYFGVALSSLAALPALGALIRIMKVME